MTIYYTPVILWTDMLVFLLLAVLLIYLFKLKSNPDFAHRWKKVCSTRLRKIALIFLLIYSIIGFLDCLHYRNKGANEVKSVLDYLLLPISEIQEVSYSAPFAKNLFDQPIISGHNTSLVYKGHILGTDKVGTDVFYAALKSVRTGLIIGILTTVITLPFAVLFGCLAGYLGGWVDDLIQYLYTTLSSVPAVLLIAATMLMLDAVLQRHSDFFATMAQRTDLRLLLLCCVLGLSSWTSLCRILRGETLKLREQEFVLAAKVLGRNTWQIIAQHIVPNLMHIILISLALDFSGLVLAEAVLTYVGVGVDPSTYSWGVMINAARMELGRDPIIWWPLFGAFILMFILVLSANIFADGVRDAFDPKAE